MSTLIVQLPARVRQSLSQDWHLADMPFVLLDGDDAVRRSGRASIDGLPRARTTLLLLASVDLVTMSVRVPEIRGPRLRQALPNLIEDQLIGDAQRLHIALDGRTHADGTRTVYAVDRAWFQYLFEAFVTTGHPSVRMLPNYFGIAPPEGDTLASVLVVAASIASADVDGSWVVELAIRTADGGLGLSIPPAELESTLSALYGAHYTVQQLAQPDLQSALEALRLGRAIATVPFDDIALRALKDPLNLCQFEFEQAWKLKRGALRRWRMPMLWAAACVVVALVGLNTQWILLSRERDALMARTNDLLTSSFPRTTVILDAPLQMTRQLDALRVAAGELSPADFLSEADAIARALPPITPDAVQTVDYAEHGMTVTFKPGTMIDRGFLDRLAANGLDGRSEDLRWFIKVHP